MCMKIKTWNFVFYITGGKSLDFSGYSPQEEIYRSLFIDKVAVPKVTGFILKHTEYALKPLSPE